VQHQCLTYWRESERVLALEYVEHLHFWREGKEIESSNGRRQDNCLFLCAVGCFVAMINGHTCEQEGTW